MIDADSYEEATRQIRERIAADGRVLDTLRAEIRPLKDHVCRIQPRRTTSISLVGTDGGNNRFNFDPFMVQVVRVVDSSNNEYCLEVVTPTTSVSSLSASHFKDDGSPKTPLGALMKHLGVRKLTELSHMIRSNDRDEAVSPSWVQVYRELIEWATLLSLVETKEFGTDTLIVFDGLLRSKVFAGDKFNRYVKILETAIQAQFQRSKRRVFLVGVAKHSKVIDRYRLAMALEAVLTINYPAYIEVPRDVEQKAYVWSEYARGSETEAVGAEINKFVGGKMFLVKFGAGRRDSIWPVDIFEPQRSNAQLILGCLLADAINGFPVPFYPQCLQKAHENAALVDFDFDILQDRIYEAIRISLGEEAGTLDNFTLQDADISQRRY